MDAIYKVQLLWALCLAAPAAPERMDGLLDPIRAKHGQPALAAAAARAQGTIAVGAAGVRKIAAAGPVKLADRFHIGSCTKSMTATLAALVVEDGTLAWDRTVLDALPAFSRSIHADYRKVTLEQLLHHQAGIPPFKSLGEAEQRLLRDLPAAPSAARREFAKRVLAEPPEVKPGTEALYSNAGYSVAACVIEAVAGEPWESLLQKRLFRPLGMERAGFGWPLARARLDEPWGHSVAAGGILRPEPADAAYRMPAALAPAGDVHASIEDFARYARVHLRGLRGESTLLKAATVKTLHEPAGDFAMGWIARDVAGEKASWHNGSAGTFFAWMSLWPERDLAIVVVTNAGNGEEACQEATEKLFERFKGEKRKPAGR